MNTSYTPEKIDEFVLSAEKERSTAENVFRAVRSKMYDITIQNAIESSEEINSLLDKVKQTRLFLNNKAQKYYKIVEMYDVADYPDNIYKLDDLVTKLDNINDDFYLLAEALEHIIEATNKLRDQYFTK